MADAGEDDARDVHDGTQALKDIAAEVEAERAAGHRTGVPSDDVRGDEGDTSDSTRDDDPPDPPWGVVHGQSQIPSM